MSNIPKHLLNSKLITDEEWKEYQDLKEKINDFRIKLSAREEVANEYKERIKKAVDYIKEHIRIDDEYPAYMEMLIEERDNLLNILNGENDKSKGE